MKKVGLRKSALALAALTVAASCALLTAASASRAAAAHSMAPASSVSIHPDVSGPQTADSTSPNAVHFSCQSRPIDGSHGPRCYQPNQMQQAYGLSGLLASGVNGAGQTIVIVDAYDNPYLQGDLNIQDSLLGLPPVTLAKVAMPGVPAFNINDGNQVGWGEEETLDVLWAHAMAPGAGITLVEAASNQDSDILAAVKYAVDNNLGNVISQSFGEAETCTGSVVPGDLVAAYHAVYQNAATKGITVFASSGDSGASQYNCFGTGAILSASGPASDPLVTGVGGTTLSATDAVTTPTSPDGTYVGETAWTEQLFGCNPPALAPNDINCSGGGYSTIYNSPAFQNGFNGNPGRGVPDVSYDAGVNGGVITHCGVCNVSLGLPSNALVFFIFGGTSAGSPQWAALTADADQMAGHNVGDINPVLYGLARTPAAYAANFHDVTTGNNDVAEIGGAGYNAGTGWDAVTGLGSPNAANLLQLLASCVSGTVNGDVKVQAGQVLCLQPGASVTHDVNVLPGGTLIDEGATIGHDVVVNKAASVSMDGGSVGHDLTVQNSTGGVTITGVTVGHDLKVQNNAGPTVVSSNSAGHDSKCQSNGGQSGSGNTAAHSNGCPA
jgi:subtilase family serine protease